MYILFLRTGRINAKVNCSKFEIYAARFLDNELH